MHPSPRPSFLRSPSLMNRLMGRKGPAAAAPVAKGPQVVGVSDSQEYEGDITAAGPVQGEEDEEEVEAGEQQG